MQKQDNQFLIIKYLSLIWCWTEYWLNGWLWYFCFKFIILFQPQNNGRSNNQIKNPEIETLKRADNLSNWQDKIALRIADI